MPIESYSIDEGALDEMKKLKQSIGIVLDQSPNLTKEEIFTAIFSDPNFPELPIVSEYQNRQLFELAYTQYKNPSGKDKKK